MAMNRIQFQPGLSMSEFFKLYGTELQCAAALEKVRWPSGFCCPRCGSAAHCVLRGGTHKVSQCNACRYQTSLIAGTVMQGTKLALTVWLLAIYLISQAKTGLSALALSRHLGVSYPTAWLVQHKLMQAMAAREERYRLEGQIQVDDAYLGGERSGGKVGRGSENKVPFVAAVSLSEEGHPLYTKLTPVPGFTLKSIGQWAKGQGPARAGQYGVLRWAGLFQRRDRGRLRTPADHRRRAQAQGVARVSVDQHRAWQSQDEFRRHLPCVRFPKVCRSIPRRFHLSL